MELFLRFVVLVLKSCVGLTYTAEAIGISSKTAASYQFVSFILFLQRATGTYLLRFINSGN